MIIQDIDIREYRWSVSCFFDVRETDTELALERLIREGCQGRDLSRAVTNMGHENTGLTFSNTQRGRSVMVISNTTSQAQFVNTLTHELRHLVCHICETRGVPCCSERACYLTGTLAEIMYPCVRSLL